MSILDETKWLYSCLDELNDAVILTDESSTIIYANNAYATLSEYSLDEIIGQNPGMMRSGYHDDKFYKRIWETLKDSGKWQGEIWNRSKTGRLYPVELKIKKIRSSNQNYYLGILTDIKNLKINDFNSMNLFEFDFLTKIPNKTYLQNKFNIMAQEFKRLRHESTNENEISNKMAVFYINLNLDPINNKYGYVAGDTVLIEVAKRLHSIVRGYDLLGRFSGNSFVMILPQIRLDALINANLHTIHSILSAPIKIDGLQTSLECKVGCSTLPEDSEDFKELVAIAKASAK